MVNFSIHFLVCSLLISVLLGGMLFIRLLFKKQLTGRMPYYLWFFMPIVWVLPFFSYLPLEHYRFSLFDIFNASNATFADTPVSNSPTGSPGTVTGWMEDFTVSVSKSDSNYLYLFLTGIWIAGMLVMLFFFIRSRIRFCRIESSALAIQNRAVKELVETCKKELGITKDIPVYSTAFLTSPVLAGILKPRIYLPISLISDLNLTELRYMLLHELQHYRHKDPLMKYMGNFAKIIYWFHPLVWHSIKEMQNDCEVACDSSVLQLLDETMYYDYGNTLINFAEKASHSPFSFANGMGGSMPQMKKRIRNIASYRPTTLGGHIKGIGIFLLTGVFLFTSASLLPVNASEKTAQLPPGTHIASKDLSSFFGDYPGSFVLYDLKGDTWQIFNESMAKTRISPDSTYKIYSALLGLETGIITPDSNERIWDGTKYPISQWNQNQTLTSALQYSVNWYFKGLDQAMGIDALQDFYSQLDYGNQDLSGGLNSYWLESSLKISPVEQVQLLQKFYENTIGCNPRNIEAVKNGLRLIDSPAKTLYGKTGTGNVNGNNVNGWFIGFVESDENTYFFATNITGKSQASGSIATEITLDILENQDIFDTSMAMPSK